MWFVLSDQKWPEIGGAFMDFEKVLDNVGPYFLQKMSGNRICHLGATSLNLRANVKEYYY